MVLQAILEPVVLGLEADQHAGRLSVPGDEDLLGLGQAQEARQDIFGRISGLGPGVVLGGSNFYDSGDQSLVSADRHTTIMQFLMAGQALSKFI